MFYFLCLETALWHFRIIKNLYIVQRLFTKTKLNLIQTLMKLYMYKKEKIYCLWFKILTVLWWCSVTIMTLQFHIFYGACWKICEIANFLLIWPLLQVVSMPFLVYYYVHSNLDIVNKSVRPFLFTILNNSLYQM